MQVRTVVLELEVLTDKTVKQIRKANHVALYLRGVEGPAVLQCDLSEKPRVNVIRTSTKKKSK